MAELPRHSALDGHLQCAVQAGVRPGLSLREFRPAAMVQIMGAPPAEDLAERLAGFGLDAPPAPGRCAAGTDLRVLWTGADQYLAVATTRGAEELVAMLERSLHGAAAAVVDLSHARTVMRIEGEQAEDVLAKGCPLDLEVMRGGECAATVLSHFNILLHRQGPRQFEIYVTRSFGLSCFHWLREAGREFALAVLAEGE